MSKGAFETLMLAGPFHKRLYRADGTKLGVWNTRFQFQVFSRPVGELIFKTLPQDLSCAGLCWCPPFTVREFSGRYLFSMGAEVRVSLYREQSSSVSTQKDEAGE